MKLAKSLLLGSAAGFAVVTGASAADLPSRKAAPAEYVKVCSAYGAGFFYIPGSDICLKIGGQARYQMTYAQPFSTPASPFGTRTVGRVELDARNPTAYGTLRTFVRVDFAWRTGSERSGSGVRAGYAYDPNVANDSGIALRQQNHVILDKAFIQWGGLVAGRTNSLYDFNKSPEIIGTNSFSSMYPGSNLIGYIATFGSGFYASLSLEDAVTRRGGLSNAGLNLAGQLGGNAGLAGGVLVAPTVLNPSIGNPAGTVLYYGGFRMPDIVAAIGVDQAWGSAQVSAAVHQIPVVGPGALNNESKYGFAVQGGVQLKLDMIAPGDYIWLVASYADGAMQYVHSNFANAYLNTQSFGNSNGYWMADAYVNPVTGSVSKSKTWSVAGAFQHYWSPTLRSAIFGSYAQFNNPGAIADWDYWTAGANIVWTPVRQLDLGLEAVYQNIKGKGVNLVDTNVNTVGLKNSDGSWIGRFRIIRTF